MCAAGCSMLIRCGLFASSPWLPEYLCFPFPRAVAGVGGDAVADEHRQGVVGGGAEHNDKVAPGAQRRERHGDHLCGAVQG